MVWRPSCFVIVSALLVGAGLNAQTAPPSVKPLGNAIRQYEDQYIQAVVAYDYSHRYHDGAWLLIEAAVRTADRLVFSRRDFTVVTPNETTIALASESRFIGGAALIKQIRQNADVWSRDLNPYFRDKNNRAVFRLFALPGEGTVTDSIATERYGAAFLTLYFESATGRWPAGTYGLRIDNGQARAVIPIELK
jgi:hypothetical protein